MTSGLRQLDVIESSPRPGRWAQSKLNIDTYDYIMSMLGPNELVVMMRTCSTLHSAGIKYLVNWPGKLTGTKTLQSFCQFVLQDKSSRIKLLRTLSLNLTCTTSRDRATIDPLFQVLSQAHNLRRLEMIPGADMFRTNSELVRSPYAMRSLRSLNLGHVFSMFSRLNSEQCGAEHANLLRTLQSPLEELKITFMRLPWNLSRSSVSFLANFRDTLHTLSIYGYPLGHEEPIVLPRVHTLEMSFCDVSYDTEKMCAMFPNVVNVKFGDHSLLIPPMTDDEVDHAIKRNEVLRIDHQWAHLRIFRGSVSIIHQAGLKCSVDELRTCLDLEDAQRFIGLMPQLQVQTLNIELLMSDACEVLDDPAELLHKLIRSWSNVEKLYICLRVDCDAYVHDIFDALTKLPASSKLERLSIEVAYEYHPDRDIDEAYSIAEAFKSIDVQRHVTEIAQALLALSEISVFVPCNSRSEWTIERSNRKLAVVCRAREKDPDDWYTGGADSDDESDEGSEDSQPMREYRPNDINDLLAYVDSYF